MRRPLSPTTARTLDELGTLLRAELEWLRDKPVKVWECRPWIDEREGAVRVHVHIRADNTKIAGSARESENWPTVLRGDFWWLRGTPRTRLGRHRGHKWLRGGSGGGDGKTFDGTASIDLDALPKIRALVEKNERRLRAEQKRDDARRDAIEKDREVSETRTAVNVLNERLAARTAVVGAAFDKKHPPIRQFNLRTGQLSK